MVQFYKTLKITKKSPNYSGKDPKNIFFQNNTNKEIGENANFKMLDGKGNIQLFSAKVVANYEENIATGRFSDDLKKFFNRRIAQYLSRANELKIGITSRNPKIRFEEHLKDKNWKRMVVLYKTTSVDYVKELERFLVNNYFDYITNEVGGGGGDLSSGGSSFLYIITT